jgi:signal transduction histidine kinase
VLCEIGGRLDAPCILMWLMNGESGTAAPRLAWSEARGPGSADDLLATEWMNAMLALAERLDPGELPAVHARTLHLPLLIGADHLGGISVLLTQTGQPPAAEIAWVQALAHQATLALRLDFLSAGREAAAVSKERARIAREIHDGIAQTFIGINRHLHGAFAHTECPAVASAIELAKDGLAEARRTMRGLGPHQLSNMPFLDAVQEVARKVIPQKIQFLLSSTGTWPALAPERESNLFRVVQEAFNNVARHSSATRLNLDVSSTPGELSILIQDNGCGFDVHGMEAGFGLANMRHRMEAIDGFFQLVSAPGSGTQVHIRLACA